MSVTNDYDSIYQLYDTFSPRADLVYKFVSLYSDYMNDVHDYGVQASVNMLEAHVLTDIFDNPGVNATQLTKHWGKTKGAISQTVTKLVNKGYVNRGEKTEKSKMVPLYATPKGEELAKAHKVYDVLDITDTMQKLKQTCTTEEIDGFYHVLEAFTHLMEE